MREGHGRHEASEKVGKGKFKAQPQGLTAGRQSSLSTEPRETERQQGFQIRLAGQDRKVKQLQPQGRGLGHLTHMREQAVRGIKGARKQFGGTRKLADQG